MATESFHKRSGYVLVIIRITVPGRLLPSEDPIAESVLESLIMVHSRTLSAMGSSDGRRRPGTVPRETTHTYPLRSVSGPHDL